MIQHILVTTPGLSPLAAVALVVFGICLVVGVVSAVGLLRGKK